MIQIVNTYSHIWYCTTVSENYLLLLLIKIFDIKTKFFLKFQLSSQMAQNVEKVYKIFSILCLSAKEII